MSGSFTICFFFSSAIMSICCRLAFWMGNCGWGQHGVNSVTLCRTPKGDGVPPSSPPPPALPHQDLFCPSPPHSPLRAGAELPHQDRGMWVTFTSGWSSLPGEPDSASLAAASCFFHSSMSCSAFLGEVQGGCAEPGGSSCGTAAPPSSPRQPPAHPNPAPASLTAPKGSTEPQGLPAP